MAEVHILHLGGALCGKVGTPSQWEDGHKWVALLDDDHGPRSAATCEDCLRSARHRDPITGAMTAELSISRLRWVDVAPLIRTRVLLRRFAAQWNETEADPATRQYVGPRFELLRELLDAFEAEDLGD